MRVTVIVAIASAIACGGSRKPPPDMPSRKDFFLRRDTPVDSIRLAFTEGAPDASLPVGDVEGIVIDAYWGDPMPSAQIIYRDTQHPEKSIGAVTDAEGHFHLKGLPPRSVVLHATRIGDLADTMRVDGGSGQFILFALRRQAMHTCALPVSSPKSMESPFAISVYVRDARTSKAPRAPITFSLRDGKFVDSETIQLRDSPADSVLLGAARGRDGVYDLEILAPGYKPWFLKKVRPIVSDCDGFLGRVLPAWLIPTG